MAYTQDFLEIDPGLQYMPQFTTEEPTPAPRTGSRSPLLMEAMRRLLMAQAPPEPTTPLDERMKVIQSMGNGRAGWRDIVPGVVQSAFTAMAQPGTGSAVRDFAIGGAMGAGAYNQAEQLATQRQLMRQRLGLQAIQDTEEAKQKANDSRVRQGSANVRALSAMQRMIDSEKSLEREENKKPPSTYEFKGTSDGKLYRVDSATGEYQLIAGGQQALTGKAAEISGMLRVMGVPTDLPWEKWTDDARKMAAAIAGVPKPTINRMDPKTEAYRRITEALEAGKSWDDPSITNEVAKLTAITKATTTPRAAPRATGGPTAATQRASAVEQMYNFLNPQGLTPGEFVTGLENGSIQWPEYVDGKPHSVRRADVIKYAGDLMANSNRAKNQGATASFFFGGPQQPATPAAPAAPKLVPPATPAAPPQGKSSTGPGFNVNDLMRDAKKLFKQ